MSKAFIEGLKELARNCFLSGYTVIAVALTDLISGNSVDWRRLGIVAGATVGLALLTGINKWVHKSISPLPGITPI